MSKLGLLKTLITTKLIDAVKRDEDVGLSDISDGLIGIQTSIFISELAELAAERKTTISGPKYSYTIQVDDALVSYGFDTHDELSRFVKAERHFDKSK
jgi:hypothetical protein